MRRKKEAMSLTPELFIEEYSDSIIKNEDLQIALMRNWGTYPNLNIYGVHQCLLRNYGFFVWTIYTISIAIIFWVSYALIFMISFHFIEYNNFVEIEIVTIVVAIFVLTLIYCVLLPAILMRLHKNMGQYIFQKVSKIKENYMSDGDENFWILYEVNTIKEKNVIGIAALKKMKDGDKNKFGLANDSKIGYIDIIAIKDKYRKSGNGKKLMERIISYAKLRKYEYLTAFIDEYNAPGIKFLQKYHMTIKRELKRIPILGVRLFIMVAQL